MAEKILPVVFDVKEQLEDLINKPLHLNIRGVLKSQQHLIKPPNYSNGLFCEVSDPPTELRMERNPTTGKVLGIYEDFNDLENTINLSNETVNDITSLTDIFDVLNGGAKIEHLEDLLSIPEGFERGHDFVGKLEESATSTHISSDETTKHSNIIDLSQLLVSLPDSLDSFRRDSDDDADKEILEAEIIQSTTKEVIEKLPNEIKLPISGVLEISKATGLVAVTSTEWAEMLDVTQPVTDFHQRLPNPAFKYEFELDTFQKQAILKLEEHCNVLVSAHTSAGKTVVAEYAIALSQRHLTRTIYTSPIKALSNQKYREFRRTFHDVGLVTGDFQVNSTGTCLVVTTEILKSMLLAQNDVIRDLEFVIFDEVHYINDMDRGHVWEETVILLPPHVSIVMLSATVPNALQFADWVGRTKQRRMYVVSTLHRPVPLKHFLYTGSGGSTKNDRFLILDNNDFKRSGYQQALQSVEKKGKTVSASRDRPIRLNPKQESTLWVALIEHLLANDELPIVAFTLSRKRCDLNAEALTLDLTNSKEKSHIRYFFRQSIMRLNQNDRQLPQILQLQKLLERGVGVHHSGILPILKEIVELLFQEKCVKVLFATETFAMGVNMPAKTVVFDAIFKFDGLSERLLLPSEYIQMAGRAGRRGLDENGNVLILCKGAVPAEEQLTSMMMGQPKKIESQFRLTYSIILKLERKRIAAEGKCTVEEMMANSFMEAENVKKKSGLETNLNEINDALTEAKLSVDQGPSWDTLKNVAKLGIEFLDLWHQLSPELLSSKVASKYMIPGRIICVTHDTYINKLGVLLSSDYKKLKFRVLILGEENPDALDDNVGFNKLIALAGKQIHLPTTLGGHILLYVDPWDILDVTTEVIKLDPTVIVHDWQNRQIPRFRNNPPGESFSRVLEELVAITHKAHMAGHVETLSLVKDFPITTNEQIVAIRKMTDLKSKLQSMSLDAMTDWQRQLEEIFRLSHLEKERENMNYLLSYKSMSLYGDYQSRLTVLRELNYVDAENAVLMKGNVACEMSNHEILITELVLRNKINHLKPAEIAALLSCFVYQGKETGPPPSVSTGLDEAIITIRELEKEILALERKCGVQPLDPFAQERNLNFDLLKVVHEWALDKPFAEIMLLTEIQEGVIVRCIQQLNETIKDVRDAARIIGEPTLQQKMEEASTAIKRDIVFAASLYMQ